MAVDWVTQAVVPIVVGVSTGIGATILSERATARRYQRQREDRMLPAIQRLAYLYRWEGEHLMDMRRGATPEGEIKKAVDALRPYLHDLPLALQDALADESTVEYGDPFDYGDHLVGLAGAMDDYRRKVVTKRVPGRWRSGME